MRALHPLVKTVLAACTVGVFVLLGCWLLDCDALYVHSDLTPHRGHGEPPPDVHGDELAGLLGLLDFAMLDHGRQTYALPMQSLNDAHKCHRGRGYHVLADEGGAPGVDVHSQRVGGVVTQLVHRCFPPMAYEGAWLGDLDGNRSTAELLVGVHGDSGGAPLAHLCLFSAGNPQLDQTRADCLSWPWDLRGDEIEVELPEDPRLPAEVHISDHGRSVDLALYPNNHVWSVAEYEEGETLKVVTHLDRWMLQHGRMQPTVLMYEPDGTIV